MKNNIARIMKSMIIVSVMLLSSCSKSPEIAKSNMNSSDIQTIPKASVSDETFKTVNNSGDIYTVSEYKEIDISDFDCTRINLNAYSGNNLFLTYLNDDLMEIYRFDTKDSSRKYIAGIEWNVMYNFLSQVVGERYFVIMPSKNSSGKLISTLFVYDIETEEFYEADNFMAHNMVQYMTNVGNDKLAYLYYEAITKDRIIKIYDFESKTSEEIYRISSDDEFSPMGLAFNGENIVLALQLYNDKFETETLFKEIDLSGNDITSSSSKDFALELISNVKYNSGYYIVCGYKYRATREYSTVYTAIKDLGINTVVPLNSNLEIPLNYTNNNNNIDLYCCNTKTDFASIDISKKSLQYFNVDIPDCKYIYAAVSNEKNDIAVIKYSDENFGIYKLVIIRNDIRLTSMS